MLVAAAVCPHPPLLVPEVAAGAAVETDDLRAACDTAVATLLAARPGLVVVVGDGPETLSYGSADWGSLAGYGVPLSVALGPRACTGQPVLPLALTIGAWLLRRTPYTGDRQGYAVVASTSARDAAAAGRELAALDDRVGLLVMGDGSARRSTKAPGYLDERSEAFDAAAARALADADPPALLGIEAALAAELLAAGRASWQVLAGAAGDRRYHATLHYDEAPYGVGYLVASWTARAT